MATVTPAISGEGSGLGELQGSESAAVAVALAEERRRLNKVEAWRSHRQGSGGRLDGEGEGKARREQDQGGDETRSKFTQASLRPGAGGVVHVQLVKVARDESPVSQALEATGGVGWDVMDGCPTDCERRSFFTGSAATGYLPFSVVLPTSASTATQREEQGSTKLGLLGGRKWTFSHLQNMRRSRRCSPTYCLEEGRLGDAARLTHRRWRWNASSNRHLIHRIIDAMEGAGGGGVGPPRSRSWGDGGGGGGSDDENGAADDRIDANFFDDARDEEPEPEHAEDEAAPARRRPCSPELEPVEQLRALQRAAAAKEANKRKKAGARLPARRHDAGKGRGGKLAMAREVRPIKIRREWTTRIQELELRVKQLVVKHHHHPQ
uniref:Uncharacterized protein n=1 Tax=Oryza meridionalis TaxID=40149 RepID=A0A0E0EK60_9ORYZ